LGLRLGVAHAVLIVAEVAERLRDAFVARMLRAQMAQRPDDLPNPAGLVTQPMPVLLELSRRLGASVP